jgi:hypothetical protein
MRHFLVGMGLLMAGNAFGAPDSAVVLAPGKVEIQRLHAKGVQIYECKVDGSGGSTWQFREPFAILLKNGVTVGRHFAGPTWQLTSGSEIAGSLEDEAPGQSPKDVALLKLAAVRKHGGGEFARVTTVQRLNTHGGAFRGGCDKPGALHLEPYTADYVFLGN